MFLTQARLSIRLNRFALLVVGATALVASLAAVVVAAALRAAATPECLASRWDSSATVACQAQVTNFYQIDGAWAGPLMGIIGGIAPIGGLLVGVSLVAREIEDRTAAMAWSLAPSRTRWLVGRVAPVAVVLLVLFAVTAIAATGLEGARSPSLDPLLSFYNESSRGLELVALGFMVFCAAVLVGSILGRVLPALIVAAVLGLVLTVGAFVAESNWVQTQAVMVNANDASNADGSLVLDQLLRLPSGELVPTWSVQWDDQDANGNFIGPLAGAVVENKVVRGSRHPFVEAVDAAGMAAVSAVLLVLTGVVVNRRRPT